MGMRSRAGRAAVMGAATQLDSSMRGGMPDSTTGGPSRTGTRGVAGDTLSTRGRPVGTGVVRPDSTRKRP